VKSVLQHPVQVFTSESEEARSYSARCPRCGNALGNFPEIGPRVDAVLTCTKCSFRLRSDHGIWSALPLDRQTRFGRFIAEYQIVRQKEGRGSKATEYYTALPYRDLSGNNQSQWKIRARTYRHLEKHILPHLDRLHPKGAEVLDLGAGNGWLSYRLALRGHHPAAVDLLVNDMDGLGAAVHYESVLPRLFPRFQAEFDHLPFADNQFDCAVFNASFHYSEDYECTLKEAIRCVRNGGFVIVCDSPWYSDERSGRQMVEERKNTFTAKFGFPSDSLSSKEYLTDSILISLERRCGIQWGVEVPYYGIAWSLRPLLARVRRRREPSRFRIYIAEVRK
jgi:SAM-dependent methyltransferase